MTLSEDIDLQPTLIGKNVLVRPLHAEDFDLLYAAASDPNIWASHPDSERYKEEAFQERFFAGAVSSNSAFVFEDKSTGQVLGSSRYYEWDEKQKEIAIGYTFIIHSHWGKGTNAEVKALMLEHIYQWADKVWFHIGEDNIRSRRAVEKLGAEFSHGEDRNFMGIDFTQVYYKLDKSKYLASRK